ncbi:MAG: hypothetical protein WEB88_12320 [Gemmatimonadota bacterium]
MRRCCFLLTALPALAACAGSGDAPAAETFRVDTVAGVVRAVNVGAAPPWTLAPERVIGSLGGQGDDPAPDEFGTIRWLALDRTGNVYVADDALRQIQVFNSAGAHVRALGGQGGGPGEFRSVPAMAFLGDTLVVMDPGNARLSLLDRRGVQLGQWPMLRMTGTADWFHDLGGGIVAMMSLVPSGAERALGYILMTSAGPFDTIVPPPAPERAVVTGLECDSHDGSIHFWTDPLAPRRLAVPAPGGLMATAWSDAYRIAFLDTAGDTMRTVSRPDRPTAVPDSMRTRLDAAYADWRGGLPMGTSCDPAGRGDYEILPPLEHIAFDERGRMWVETLGGQGRGWDVFSPEGRLLGSAPAAARHERVRPAIRDNRVAVVEEAPAGHHRVVVYRLRAGR